MREGETRNGVTEYFFQNVVQSVAFAHWLGFQQEYYAFNHSETAKEKYQFLIREGFIDMKTIHQKLGF